MPWPLRIGAAALLLALLLALASGETEPAKKHPERARDWESAALYGVEAQGSMAAINDRRK